jgi:hypothetical protein
MPNEREIDDSVVSFAEIAAEAFEKKFAGDPEGEMLAWLYTAQQREAMVATAYTPEYVSRALRATAARLHVAEDVREIIDKAIGSVWAQERAHDAYLTAVLRVIDPPESFVASLKAFFHRSLGRIQGVVVPNLMATDPARQALARIALAVGSLVDDVPEFAGGLRARDFASYCRFNVALEKTAVRGYARLQGLINEVSRENVALQASTVAIDNARTLKDERYHEGLFLRFARWADDPPPPPPGGPAIPSRTAESIRGDDDDWTLGTLSAARAADAIIELQRRVYKGDDLVADLTVPSDASLEDDALVALLHARAHSERLVDSAEEESWQATLAAEPAQEASSAHEQALEAIDQALKRGRTLEG